MMRVRSAVVAAVLGAGLVLAGCGGQEEPKPLEGQSDAGDNAPDDAGGDQGGDTGGEEDPSDDSTPSDGSGEDERVERDDHDVAAGGDGEKAKAVVAAYIKALNKATATGDLSAVNKIAGPDCQICNTSRKNITTGYANGGRIEGGGFVKPNITAGTIEGRTVVVTVTSWFTPYKMFNSAGKEVASGPEENATFFFEVDLDSSRIVKGEQQ